MLHVITCLYFCVCMCSFVMLNKECEPSSDESTLQPLWIVLGVLAVIFVVIVAVAVKILLAKKKPATDNVDAQEQDTLKA